MKIIIFVLLMVFCSAPSVQANPMANPFTERNVIIPIAVSSLLLVDMLQTLDIKNHPGLQETNPILGHHPSDAFVIGYFATAGVAYVVAYNNLPPVAGLLLSLGVGALQVSMLHRNQVNGCRILF